MRILTNILEKILSKTLNRCCKKRFFAIVAFWPLLLILCISSCSFYNYIMDVRITTKSDVCAKQIRQLAIAMQVYFDVYGSYPPPISFDKEGKPMHSWRALILPYLEETIDSKITLKYDYSVPWDHPNNVPLHYKMPNVFRCPCESDRNKLHSESSYDMIFDFENRECPVIPFSNKNILLIEVFNTGVNWLQPVSIDNDGISKGVKSFNDLIPSLRLGSKHPITNENKRYFMCVNDHGEVLNLPTDISPRLLEILTKRDNK